MDQQTRNQLQNATQRARRLLETEIAEQLSGTFDILPDGTIGAKPGPHLSPAQRLLRLRLVEAVKHKAGGSENAEKLKEAVGDYTREAAFTILHRFVALKMLEARGLLQQCVSKGDQSSGFKEFALLAPGLSSLPDKGYRLYLECLFDELSIEVKILFDRHDSASLLWPKKQTLDDLLAILNDTELASVWSVDETIGWVYQYFNSDADRKDARYDKNGKPKAPQNSRELAVRNQFFTPRYVVEFLTDNTLGRIWYEMRQGVTALREQCRYLVRRPDEVFLETPGWDEVWPAHDWLVGKREEPPPMRFLWSVEGLVFPYRRRRSTLDDLVPWVKSQLSHLNTIERAAKLPTQDLLDIVFLLCRIERTCEGTLQGQDAEISNAEAVISQRVAAAKRQDLTQQELLELPVFIPFRAKKDPRDIKILDPACGSSHFLLYCFDLLLTIYEEAWADEEPSVAEATGQSLRADYPSVERLHRAVPGLILRHNVHGIDIDTRCAQIGAFALWMRTQRAYNDFKITREDRPPITRSNIVVAEPMPGEKDLLEEFLQGLQEDRLESLIRAALIVPAEKQVRATKAMAESLRDLIRTIWGIMKLAGEAGSLLRVDSALEDAIAKGRQEWEQKLPLFRVTQYGIGEPAMASLLREVPREEADFWTRSETIVLRALELFAVHSGALGNGSFRRSLFAEDATRGMAFIDLCRLRLDVVLMNPPFGAATVGCKRYLEQKYPRTKNDLYAAFVERGIRWLHRRGMLGAITSRTGFFLASFQRWREDILLKEAPPTVFVDLGHGVMDAAMVEAAAYCLEVNT